MNVHWLLEKDVFSENLEPMKAAITGQGFDLKIHDYTPMQSSRTYLDLYKYGECVVFYGTLGFGKQIAREASWVPGVYCNLAKLECSHYYAHLGEYLLNERYIMMPYADLKRRKEFVFDTLGIQGTVFVRPSSGSKLFHGQLLEIENFDKQYEKLNFYDFSSDALVVLAEPVNLDAEWRLVVCDKKIIAASQYRMQDFMPKIMDNCPEDVREFGQKIAEGEFQPDPAWVLDIARTRDGRLRLIEINSFSCSGLYACDKEAVVREVSKVALKEWQEIYAKESKCI